MINKLDFRKKKKILSKSKKNNLLIVILLKFKSLKKSWERINKKLLGSLAKSNQQGRELIRKIRRMSKKGK
jgi:hypothetical protein